MNIEISPAASSWIEQQLAAGFYKNHEDALQRIIESGIESEQDHRQAIAEVDAMLQQGIDELDAGLGISQEDFEAEMNKRYGKKQIN
jgi:Arc/MetJ-type ribon-helix-helix transcriptional regulator